MSDNLAARPQRSQPGVLRSGQLRRPALACLQPLGGPVPTFPARSCPELPAVPVCFICALPPLALAPPRLLKPDPPPRPWSCFAALNSEQKALLDFLVLARSQLFAGFGSSTFSFYLREYRALQVRPSPPASTL